jgi:hypothetical protein
MAKGTGPEGDPWAATGLEVLWKADFADGKLNRPGTYVVCFAAAWCPFTRRFIPHFVSLNGTVPATVAIADITDLNDPLWDDFRIRITPSIIVFCGGTVQLRVDGRRFLGITRSALDKFQQSFNAG